MSAVSRPGGNKEDFIELFILTYRKSLNMSVVFDNFGGNVRTLRSLVII